jgi:intracellular multiplication protein IcmP
MAAAPQQGGQESSAGILWITAAIFALMMAIWYKGQKYIVIYYFKLKLLEIDVLSYITSNLDDVRTSILVSDPATTTFDTMLKVGQAVGYYLRIPCIVIIFFLAILVYTTNKVRIYKRIYSMRDLVNLEKSNWAQSTPIAGLDLMKADIDKGPWAMAMTPMQFCKRNGLLEEYRKAPQEGVSRKEGNKAVPTDYLRCSWGPSGLVLIDCLRMSKLCLPFLQRVRIVIPLRLPCYGSLMCLAQPN